jgi:hypothetical protein
VNGFPNDARPRMILGVGIAPSLPGESYALLPYAIKNHSAYSLN